MFPPIPIPRFRTIAYTIECARRFVSEMAEFGIQVPAGSRVTKYIRALEEWANWDWNHGDPDVDGETFQRWVVAIQEISTLIRIFNWLKAPPQLSPSWLAKFQEILDGPFFPSDAADKARDTQAELIFTGGAKIIGHQVELGDQAKHEPDVIIHFENRRYAAEAKRPRSGKTVKDNVEDAADQIVDRVKIGFDPGVIFLDLSVALAKDKREFGREFGIPELCEPARLIGLEHFPRYEMDLQRNLLALFTRARGWIPTSLADQMLGISGLLSETVLIGPQRFPPPHPSVSWGYVANQLNPSGVRFFQQFTYENLQKGK